MTLCSPPILGEPKIRPYGKNIHLIANFYKSLENYQSQEEFALVESGLLREITEATTKAAPIVTERPRKSD